LVLPIFRYHLLIESLLLGIGGGRDAFQTAEHLLYFGSSAKTRDLSGGNASLQLVGCFGQVAVYEQTGHF
jgi:hypothetical protein